MFKCGITGRMSDLGEAQHKVVVERREKEYSAWREDQETEEWEFVRVSAGWEIAKEIPATEEGLKLWESWSPEQQQSFVKSLEKSSTKMEDPKRRVVR